MTAGCVITAGYVMAFVRVTTTGWVVTAGRIMPSNTLTPASHLITAGCSITNAGYENKRWRYTREGHRIQPDLLTTRRSF